MSLDADSTRRNCYTKSVLVGVSCVQQINANQSKMGVSNSPLLGPSIKAEGKIKSLRPIKGENYGTIQSLSATNLSLSKRTM